MYFINLLENLNKLFLNNYMEACFIRRFPLSSCETQAGITPAFKRTMKPIRCPRCYFEFSIFLARALACQGCRQSVTRCEKVRCPQCDYEFHLGQTPVAKSKTLQKRLSTYVSNVLESYIKEQGESPAR